MRGLQVVTFTADLGQGEELEPARKKVRPSSDSDAVVALSALLSNGAVPLPLNRPPFALIARSKRLSYVSQPQTA
eukprot:967772-Pyramimonas_sp.AAC.2